MSRYLLVKHGQVTILDQESAELADIDEAAKRRRKPQDREGETAALDTWQVIAHRGGVIVADE